MRKMVALAVVAGFLFAGPAQAQEKKEKPKRYRFTAFAVNMGSGPKAAVIDITLERLTTAEERDNLIAAFVEGGQDKLLSALQKVKPRVGFIRSPSSLGYDLQTPGGSSIRTARAGSSSAPTGRSASSRPAGTPGRWTTRSRSSRCVWTPRVKARAGWRPARRSRRARTARPLSSRTRHLAGGAEPDQAPEEVGVNRVRPGSDPDRVRDPSAPCSGGGRFRPPCARPYIRSRPEPDRRAGALDHIERGGIGAAIQSSVPTARRRPRLRPAS